MPNIDIRVKPSNIANILLGINFLGIQLIIYWVDLQVLVQLALSICLQLYTYRVWRKLNLKNNDAIVRVQCNENGWVLQNKMGAKALARVNGMSYVSRFFICIMAECEHSSKAILLPRDVLSRKQFHLLTYILRIEA
jgi:hypothetical protein